MDEIIIFKQIVDGDLDGKKCVVKLVDYFKYFGLNGQYVCMVFEYLGDNFLILIKYLDYSGIFFYMVKEICFYILVGLDYLYCELLVIYIDFKFENVLFLSIIDLFKDLRKLGVFFIFLVSKVKFVFDIVFKIMIIINGELIRNQKKKIKKKVKRVV